jgi:hypothetical protein
VNAARFWAKVLYRDDHPDSCAIWCGNLNELGYGRVRVHGRLRAAHRVAYELSFGPVPEHALVRQRCGERACCRPEHLELHYVTRLTPEQFQAIRTRPESGRYLAKVYGVSQTRVWQIKSTAV